MTLAEKSLAVQEYCWGQIDCGRCHIVSVCNEAGGNLNSNEAACIKAYKLLVSLNLAPAEDAEKAPDNVNHPAHYETGKYECIDVMLEALGADVVKGFCLGNAFKYLYRCKHKHQSPTEDVKKALWYLNKFVELEG